MEDKNVNAEPNQPPAERSAFTPAGDPGDDPLTRNLKRAFAEVAAEPIPEEWLKLIALLEAPPPEVADE